MTKLREVIRYVETRIPGLADRTKLVEAVNAALMEIGRVTKTDETLVVEPNKAVYTLPSGVSNIVRVQVAADKSEREYMTHYHWQEVGGELHFPSSICTGPGNKIRLYYNADHDYVENDNDEISNQIPLALICGVSVYRYALANFESRQNQGVKDKDILSMLMAEAQAVKLHYRVNRMQRDPILGRN